jgi:hypothetical protein
MTTAHATHEIVDEGRCRQPIGLVEAAWRSVFKRIAVAYMPANRVFQQ